MKHACPRCQELTISGLAKRWSDRACPAKCANCGCLSHVLASTSGGIGAGTFLALVASMVAAAGLMSYLVAVSGACLAFAFNMWAWKRAMLVPIPKENMDAARTVGWFLAGVYALLALFGN
ncbi:hypothetical protein AB4Z46_00490 [Variovorax sp. M-6]|uniref:hypothetical protein n=1 Tax=Variovorax sp. M-6 TaxID=3233041 RepID=UPI003F9DAEEA